MAVRYTPDELKFLKDSPLVVKPPSLPPLEQWMGSPADTTRNPTKLQNEKARGYDSDLILDTPNKKPAHVARNSANPEDIILGPPKTSFMSATSIRNTGKAFDAIDRTLGRDTDSRDRFNFRSNRGGEGDNEHTREGRNNNLRVRRAEGDQDSDGWSTVKPRKSFGNEGAERFNGRMGLDRHKDERRFKDREDRDVKDRPSRGFDSFSREKDTEDQERDVRRNGNGRGRNEPSWFKDTNESAPAPRDRNSNGDRFIDRSRGWREKEREDKEDRGVERGERHDRRDRGGRTDRGDGERGDRGDRRWDRDRDHRQEREPEWLAEPDEEKTQAHTQEEFQKWKEQMAGKNKPSVKTPAAEAPSSAETGASFFGLEKPQKVETPLAMDTGPDKFFGKWALSSDEVGPDSGIESRKEGMSKAKTTGKASRFTSFFTPQEEPPRRQTEPPPPMPIPPQEGLEGLFPGSAQSTSEKEAFDQLIQKLQSQTVSGIGLTPSPNISQASEPPVQEKPQLIPVSTPETFQQYRTERPDREEARQPARDSQQALQDLLAQRQAAYCQPIVRPEQMAQELVGQRQNAQSQSSIRPDQQPSRNNNTEFLMGLMQSAKAAPEPQRSEQVLLRMPPGQKSVVDRQMHQQMLEREQEMQREAAVQRERIASQRQARTQPPPGFFDEPAFHRGPLQHGRSAGNAQPTQILQRPPPAGLDMGWDRQAQLPPQHRLSQNIPPPPGLSNGPHRAMAIPQQMFPPGFTMGNFPPDVMPPPRNLQMQPPPGFFNPPPPGFMPPGMGGFQGPEGMPFGGPFDGRGPPPQGTYRRQ
ncbi:hypothetical protein BJ875DRAFT_26789 [Amylocarpus encephaloides]|uniref:Uncharacterized protein n=1 Tax=Amylocarpus encephaloides TaxID=45428 RepID=A0A9P7YI57_9HELO|nr:hypothetical protein BJ875DRAFT_26789 [Amylocarpus encephaloides]